MNQIFQEILNCKEASALPHLRESGKLPALISGLSPVHRANLAAALADAGEDPFFVVCPDDSTMDQFASDLRAMTGEEICTLNMRQFDRYHTEASSHTDEQKRIATLYKLAKEESRVTVASIQGLIERTLPKEELLNMAFSLEVGGSYPPEDVIDALLKCGYTRTFQVEGKGQFAQRGGILDFFSPSSDNPIRMEYWGDDIDTMAYFDVSSQRRIEEIQNCVILPAEERISENFASGFDYIPETASVFLDQPKKSFDRAEDFIRTLEQGYYEENPSGRLMDYPLYMADSFITGDNIIPPRTLISIPAKQLPSYAGNMQAASEDVTTLMKSGYRVMVLAADERRRRVLRDYFKERNLKCETAVGSISAGFEYPSLKLAVLTDAQLVHKTERKKPSRKRFANSKGIESYADLSVGDLVVHENHGIGRFVGIVQMESDGVEKDYVKIQYAGSDVLYVPATALDAVSKYTGAQENPNIRLSKMGGTEWQVRRTKAKGAAREMAEKLIRLYAERLKVQGYAFSPDNEWQREFEANFDYTETDDQLRCIAEIKKDMESSVPMDRLLCGDVGFGKTEVAFRAVMKCLMDGKQAAILAPTTVLAQQHYQTALQRFFGFPVTIDVLSRFSTKNSQTIQNIANGKCDLVIGTHRLLSKDVQFKNLGLLVVDEEQRFGVTHKEHIKELSRGIDILTLSATPIPRTMNMAMSGIRDMSIIEEPPEDRSPVQTFVMEHNWDTVTDAITRELGRGGQVYYLHNRVEDIDRTARKLQDRLENASIAVAHGQMDKKELAEVMDRVVSGDVQILVCTTIIETGIDIPNVNTLIIEDADKLGLAQLHQIRGRVGRSARRASAYLTYRRDKVLTEDAEKRLNAIRDFAEFNSGMKIALRDLEIRGAGNLLGAEQSGHLSDVGYDMYMKLLNEAVLEARGIEVPQKAECSADLAVSANIPDRYISSSETRMDIYREIAMVRTDEEAEDLLDELIDRFGDPPPGVNALIQIALLRGEAGKAGIVDISQKQGNLNFTVQDDAGAKAVIKVKIKNKNHVIDEARSFVKEWAQTKSQT